MKKIVSFVSNIFSTLFGEFKFRGAIFLFGNLVVLGILILTDPDLAIVSQLPFGASTLNLIINLAKMTLFVSVLNLCLWTILEAGGEAAKLTNLFDKAGQTEQGSGLALISVALFAIAIAAILAAVIH